MIIVFGVDWRLAPSIRTFFARVLSYQGTVHTKYSIHALEGKPPHLWSASNFGAPVARGDGAGRKRWHCFCGLRRPRGLGPRLLRLEPKSFSVFLCSWSRLTAVCAVCVAGQGGVFYGGHPFLDCKRERPAGARKAALGVREGALLVRKAGVNAEQCWCRRSNSVQGSCCEVRSGGSELSREFWREVRGCRMARASKERVMRWHNRAQSLPAPRHFRLIWLVICWSARVRWACARDALRRAFVDCATFDPPSCRVPKTKKKRGDFSFSHHRRATQAASTTAMRQRVYSSHYSWGRELSDKLT